ncbi:hypothetical protein VE02_07989 [Pseudogymnoascus sp. 03VT05]|nr:hypothetical protein VE02_07989 [Pseudogymnoascus sp. 03VT05]
MIYGVWLRDYGGAEEAAWKKYFKAGVVTWVDLLADEDKDSDSDIFKFFTIAVSLLIANDIPNATTAFAVALKPLQESAKKLAAEAETAIRLENADLEEETEEVADGSALASQGAEGRDEGSGEPSCTQDDSEYLFLSTYGCMVPVWILSRAL